MAMRDWTPADRHGGDMELWLDAADDSTFVFDTGNELLSWLDKSGRDRHADEVGLNPFTVEQQQINDLPIVRCPGTRAKLEWQDPSPAVTDTVIMVWRWRTPNSTFEHPWNPDGSHGGGSSSPNSQVFANLGTHFYWDADLRVNGADAGLGQNLLRSTTQQMFVLEINRTPREAKFRGLGYDSPSFADRCPSVDYAEVMYFSRRLEPAELERIEGYLAWKWGLENLLDAGHPYKDAAPQTFDDSNFTYWTPQDSDATGLALWLDAGDENTIQESSGAVDVWEDKSGLVRNFAQASAPNKPAIDEWARAGKPVLSFDGSQNLISENAADTWAFLNGEGVSHVFAVLKAGNDANPNNLSIALGTGRSSSGERGWNWAYDDRSSNGFNEIFINFASGGVGPTASIDHRATPGYVPPNRFVLVGSRQDESNASAAERSRVWFAGNVPDQSNTKTTNDTDGAPPNTMRVGSAGDGTLGWVGQIAEILIYDGDLTDIQRQEIEGYLAWKWGVESDLPSGHPYADQPPGSAVSGGGGQVTGTVTVNGSPAVRQIIGITYEQQSVDDGDGGTLLTRQIVGETTSLEDGTYVLDTGAFVDEVIVLALEDYGVEWRANIGLEVGDRIRPTQPNQNGYIYEVTLAGNSGAEEPEWIIPTAAVSTMNVGAATVQGLPMFWSLAHAPVLPEVVGAPAVPWLPLEQISTFICHLDIDDIDAHTLSGGDFDIVADTGGAVPPRNFTPGNSAWRPTLVESWLSTGRRGMEFDTDDWIDGPFPDNLADFAIIFVAEKTGSQFNGFQNIGFFNAIASTSTAASGRYAQITTDNNGWYLTPNQGVSGNISKVVDPSGIHIQVARIHMGGISKYRFDGEEVGTDDTSALSPDNGVTNRIGAERFGTNPFNFVGIVGFYAIIETPTDDEILRMEGYLAHHYDIASLLPVSHPYRDAPPVVEAGGEDPAPVNPNWDSVELLISGDPGPLNAVVDNGPDQRTLTPSGAVVSSDLAVSSVYFDGVDDHIEFDNTVDFDPDQPLTIQGFLQLPNEVRSETQMIYSARRSPGDTGMNLGVLTNGELFFYSWTEVGTTYFQTSAVTDAATFPLDELTHFALTRDASGVWRTFIGGVQSHEVTEPNNAGLGNTTVYIGKQRVSTTRALKGYLRDLEFTSGIALYTEDFTPPEPPLPRGG